MVAQLRRFLLRLRYAFGSRRAEQELAREVAAHLGVLEDEYRRRGMTSDEARFAARRAMGSIEQAKELQRDARSFVWIATARRDLRFACRTLARSRSVTVQAILTLGLGIGATTAVYSAFDAAVLRPLPFPQPEQLVRLSGVGVPLDMRGLVPGGTGGRSPSRAVLDVTELSELRHVFSHAAAHATGSANLGTGPQPLRIAITFVTTEFFATLGHGAALGRVFTRAETEAAGASVAVLSDRLWRSQFGSDRSIVGKTVSIDGLSYEVIGIMPPGFRFPASAELWIPLPVPAPRSVLASFRNFIPAAIIARLAPGVSPTAAAVQLDAARRRNLAPSSYASFDTPIPSLVTPLQRWLVGDRRTALVVVMASAGLLLLSACANAATLLLSRAIERRREIATHAVLGATRGRILTRLLLESVILALAGAVLGMAIAASSLSLLSSLMPSGLAGLAPLQIDVRVLTFAITAAVITGIVFGLWPAVGASRVQFHEALQDAGSREFTAAGRLNRLLVVAQVAVACVLTIGAALMLASLRSLLVTDVGMNIERVAAARVNLPPAAYKDVAALSGFVRSVLERLRSSPSVAEAAAINTLPLAREASILLRVDPEGVTDRATAEPRHSARYLVVSPGYFRTMGIPLLLGRDLAWTDDAAVKVAVINRTLAQRFWPGEEALGKRFLFTDLRTVVGVVDDARISDPGTAAEPQVYLPIQEQPQNYVSLVASNSDIATVSALPAEIRDAVRAIDPELPIYAAEPMAAVVAETLAPRRINTILISVFGAAALGLAAIGVYGVLACSVGRRTRELGVRVALGARRRQIVGLVMRQGMGLVGGGIAIGVGGALLATRYLEGMLYGVVPRDPGTFALVALLLVATGALASLIPARRAASADPIRAIRAD